LIMNKFEQLTNYKQLLDQGVITQEEYDEIKSRMLSKNAAHEHLDQGARAVLSSIEALKKKSDGVYVNLKEKSNRWIEKELEKDRINDEEKRIKKEIKTQERKYASTLRKSKRKKLIANLGHILKQVLVSLVLMVAVLLVAMVAFYLSRDKVNLNTKETDSLHGLRYSVSDQFKTRSDSINGKGSRDIRPEAIEYELFDSSNKLIAVYKVEYLGEDIDTTKVKEEVCRSVERETVNEAKDVIIIDGYCRKHSINLQNFFSNAVMRSRTQIYTCDYSAFMVSYKCNIWNYDSESCDKLFGFVEANQYVNKNIAKTLNIVYKGSYKSGYKPVREDFDVEVQYKNGNKTVAEIYDVHTPNHLSENDNTVMIECHGLKKVIHINISEKESNNSEKTDTAEENTPLFGKDGLQV